MPSPKDVVSCWSCAPVSLGTFEAFLLGPSLSSSSRSFDFPSCSFPSPSSALVSSFLSSSSSCPLPSSLLSAPPLSGEESIVAPAEFFSGTVSFRPSARRRFARNLCETHGEHFVCGPRTEESFFYGHGLTYEVWWSCILQRRDGEEECRVGYIAMCCVSTGNAR